METDRLPNRIRALAEELDDATLAITLIDVEVHASRRPIRARGKLAALAAAAVVVIALVGTVAVLRAGRSTSASMVPLRSGPMAAGPLAARATYSSAWTGQEFIVWGGADFHNHPFADGAAYNPLTDRWRSIARSPLAARQGASAIWTGHEMFIWGGVDSQRNRWYTDGAMYDPVANHWKLIARSPLRSRQAAGVVWTGHEVIIYGGGRNSMYGDAAAYDPATNQWRMLPDPPLVVGAPNPTVVWTGTSVIVVVGSLTSGAAAAYSPRTNTWTTLPAPPDDSQPPGVWTGREVVLVGPDGAVAYVPGETGWHKLAPAHVMTAAGETEPVWTGHEVLLVGSVSSLAYDPRTNHWRKLAGVHVTPRLVEAHEQAWTGDQLLIWGGLSSPTRRGGQRGLNEGVHYVPASVFASPSL